MFRRADPDIRTVTVTIRWDSVYRAKVSFFTPGRWPEDLGTVVVTRHVHDDPLVFILEEFESSSWVEQPRKRTDRVGTLVGGRPIVETWYEGKLRITSRELTLRVAKRS